MLPKFSGGGTRCPPRGLGPCPGFRFEGFCACSDVEPLRNLPSEAGVTTRGRSNGLSFGIRRQFCKSSGGVATSSIRDTNFGGSVGKPCSSRLLSTDGSYAVSAGDWGCFFSCAGSIQSPGRGGADTKIPMFRQVSNRLGVHVGRVSSFRHQSICAPRRRAAGFFVRDLPHFIA